MVKIPYPTVNHPTGWLQIIDRINGKESSPPAMTTTSPSAMSNNPLPVVTESPIGGSNAIVPYNATTTTPTITTPTTPITTSPTTTATDDLSDDEMEQVPNERDIIIGGRKRVGDLIYEAYHNCITCSLHDFHDQINENEENCRIKMPMGPAQLSDAATRVAAVLGKEKPSPQPVLRGLVEETAKKKIKEYERRLQVLEGKLNAATSKKSKAMDRRNRRASFGRTPPSPQSRKPPRLRRTPRNCQS